MIKRALAKSSNTSALISFMCIGIFSLILLLTGAAPIHAQGVDGGCYQQCLNQGNLPIRCWEQCEVEPPVFDPLEGPSEATFDFLNPLALGSKADQLSNPGGILSEVLFFSFPLAGLILFFMLVWGGFEILLGGANKKYVDSGKQRITAAVAGFFLLFSSYWITQIVEVIFGIAIL